MLHDDIPGSGIFERTNEMPRELNFERDVSINPDALDVELLDHASLFGAYGEEWAQADRRAKRLAERKKTKAAELTMRAQQPNALPDGTKPTVGNVDAYVRMNIDYQEIVNELIEAEYEAARLKIAVDAFGYQRKANLEDLVRLCLGQYFAGPKLPRDLSKQWLESGRDTRIVAKQKERKAGRAAK